MSMSVTERVSLFPCSSHLAPSIHRLFHTSDRPSTSILLSPTQVKSRYLKIQKLQPKLSGGSFNRKKITADLLHYYSIQIERKTKKTFWVRTGL